LEKQIDTLKCPLEWDYKPKKLTPLGGERDFIATWTPSGSPLLLKQTNPLDGRCETSMDVARFLFRLLAQTKNPTNGGDPISALLGPQFPR